MTGEGRLERDDRVSLVVVHMANVTFVPDRHLLSGAVSEEEARRARYIAVGRLLIGMGMVRIRIPLMPTAIILSGALLCFLQLSADARRWIGTNRPMRACRELWRRVGRLPFVFREAMLVILTFVGFALLLLAPRSLLLGEFVIDVLLCAGLILFVGPKIRPAEETTLPVCTPVE